MGNSQSKGETMVFFNQEVPLKFSQSLVGQLEREQPKTDESDSIGENQQIFSKEIEDAVRARVSEEYKDSGASSVVTEMNIEELVNRIKRPTARTIPDEVLELKDAVIACYKKNPSLPLDCWQEVQLFKESVQRAQKKFVSNRS